MEPGDQKKHHHFWETFGEKTNHNFLVKGDYGGWLPDPVPINKMATPQKSQPIAKTDETKPTPLKQQTEGRVATVNRQKKSRGKTILDPLAVKDQGSTYRKKLLGD